MHALARVVSIRHKIDKSEADQYIFRKFCTHVHEPFSAHLSKEKNSQSTSRIEDKSRSTYNFFVISGHFDALHGNKVMLADNDNCLLTILRL